MSWDGAVPLEIRVNTTLWWVGRPGMTKRAQSQAADLLLGTDSLSGSYILVDNTDKFRPQMAQMSGKAVFTRLIGGAVELVFYSGQIPANLGLTGLVRPLFGQHSQHTPVTKDSGQKWQKM